MKNFLKKYGHAWLLLYMLLYFPWFHYLEKTVTTKYHVIHMDIDDLIPFNEYFIIPYFLWFAYVAIAVAYFFFYDKKDYYRLCGFLFTGMTIFLIISTVYPNGHHLRPTQFAHDNIFVNMVKQLYLADTPTNLFPSIHVYNSLGVHIAISHNEALRKKKWIQYGSFILMVSIILSTVFLKQHSMFDVITAFVLALLMHSVVYGRDFNFNRGHVVIKQSHDL
ncbi:MAG: phosphatase PAP2 family protein [Lachnospiraceae bacterium]